MLHRGCCRLEPLLQGEARFLNLLDDMTIQNTDSADRDGPEGKLFVSRYTEFSQHKYIQERIKLRRHFISNDQSATRNPQHDYIFPLA